MIFDHDAIELNQLPERNHQRDDPFLYRAKFTRCLANPVFADISHSLIHIFHPCLILGNILYMYEISLILDTKKVPWRMTSNR